MWLAQVWYELRALQGPYSKIAHGRASTFSFSPLSLCQPLFRPVPYDGPNTFQENDTHQPDVGGATRSFTFWPDRRKSTWNSGPKKKKKDVKITNRQRRKPRDFCRSPHCLHTSAGSAVQSSLAHPHLLCPCCLCSVLHFISTASCVFMPACACGASFSCDAQTQGHHRPC